MKNQEMSASEAIVGFCAWLTTREEITTMGAMNECGNIVDLINKFGKTNGLSNPRDGWEKKLIHPED